MTYLIDIPVDPTVAPVGGPIPLSVLASSPRAHASRPRVRELHTLLSNQPPTPSDFGHPVISGAGVRVIGAQAERKKCLIQAGL